MPFDLAAYLNQCQERVDKTLEQALKVKNSPFAKSPTEQLAPQLSEAMAYSTTNGGKRMRPALLYATAQALGDDSLEHTSKSERSQSFDLLATAVECIHAYSLIHDDLPAMDDDDLRRGKPTCHIQFGEATAILAGDALQALAFYLPTQAKAIAAEQKLAIIEALSLASGHLGMVGGQMIDLAAVDQSIDLPHLQAMHALKTGALIRVSVEIAAIACQANSAQKAALDTYADALGLAFQVQDDILDIESDTETLGKTQGADTALNKPTYPALLGLQGAKDCAAQLYQQAIDAIACFGHSGDALRELANFVIHRKH
jgi:geranylgeranyl pyrophosphate synthase